MCEKELQVIPPFTYKSFGLNINRQLHIEDEPNNITLKYKNIKHYLFYLKGLQLWKYIENYLLQLVTNRDGARID